MNEFEILPLIYASWYIIVLYLYWKKRKCINCGFIILLVWTISALAGAWYENNLIFTHTHDITLIPYIYLFCCAIILCYPVLIFYNEKIENINANDKFINLLIYFIAIINIIPCIENLIYFFQGLVAGSVFHIDTFNAKYDEGLQATWYMTNLGNKLQQISSSVRLLVLVLFFYYFARPVKNNKPSLLLSLIICVLNIILSGINSGSRNTLLTYVITGIFIYFIFNKFYDNRIKFKIKKYSYIFIFICTILFAIISIGRFKDISGNLNVNRTLPQWITSYAGESHGIFNADDWYLNGNSLKNNDFIKEFYLYEIFGIIDKPKTIDCYPPSYAEKNVQFSTVIGTYYRSYGIIFTTIALLIITLLFRKLISYKPNQKLSNILLLVYYAKIPLMGFSIFCYMFDGWQLLITPILVIILKKYNS